MDNASAQENLQHLLTFRLAPQVFALPIEPIRQVIEMVSITPIPQVRNSIEGVINYHGKIVPVVDLREHLGMKKIPLMLHTPILITTISDRLFGLIVDEVLNIIDVASNQMIDPRDILPEGFGNISLFSGFFTVGGSTLFLLNINHLLTLQETTVLANIIDNFSYEATGNPMGITISQDIPQQEKSNGRSQEAQS